MRNWYLAVPMLCLREKLEEKGLFFNKTAFTESWFFFDFKREFLLLKAVVPCTWFSSWTSWHSFSYFDFQTTFNEGFSQDCMGMAVTCSTTRQAKCKLETWRKWTNTVISKAEQDFPRLTHNFQAWFIYHTIAPHNGQYLHAIFRILYRYVSVPTFFFLTFFLSFLLFFFLSYFCSFFLSFFLSIFLSFFLYISFFLSFYISFFLSLTLFSLIFALFFPPSHCHLCTDQHRPCLHWRGKSWFSDKTCGASANTAIVVFVVVIFWDCVCNNSAFLSLVSQSVLYTDL